MNEFQQTLLRYWGYPKFREMQEEIISSVFEGNDTLGLLPTGGGKSICFQVPALMKPGICLVITPLIALMKDQVENLERRGIKAAAIYSGQSWREMNLILDNAVFDHNLKFLYLSPERLQTEVFITKLRQMKVNFLVVDESHCISQWGYDFRPSYLKIAEIRKELPGVPVLALTATATPAVVADIQEKLCFAPKNVFSKSFERKNLVYHVRETESKLQDLLRTIKSIKGTGIVYVRNRRRTIEIAEFLQKNKISADFYHAGLDNDTRTRKQEAWKTGSCRVIVSTNAFGMGIDKPDVRFVVHMDLPDSLEAYYQEAGRGGRDEKTAWAVLLVNEADRLQLEKQVEISFPPIDEIRRVYHALGNFLQVPIGSGRDSVYSFSLPDFAHQYQFDILSTYNSLVLLEREGYIKISEEVKEPSRLHFVINRQDLYNFQIRNAAVDPFIKAVLRMIPGLFSEYARIDEISISRLLKIPVQKVVDQLNFLHNQGVVDYIPARNQPYLVFSENRLDEKSIIFSPETYSQRKKLFSERVASVLNYAFSQNKCRSQMLRLYFGESNPERCGQCDVCKRRNELGLSKYEFDLVLEKIKYMIQHDRVTLHQLTEGTDLPQEKILKVIQWLLDNYKITVSDEGYLDWIHS